MAHENGVPIDTVIKSGEFTVDCLDGTGFQSMLELCFFQYTSDFQIVYITGFVFLADTV